MELMKATLGKNHCLSNLIVKLAHVFVIVSVAGVIPARAQETATSTTTAALPVSHTELAAIEHYSDVQLTLLLAELAATPLTWPEDLPNKGMGGTYWSLAHPDWPPLPATFGTPVWVLGSSAVSSSAMSLTTEAATVSSDSGFGFYLMDDIDYPPVPGYGGGDTNSYDFSSGYQAQVFTTNDLWLEITGTTNTGTSLTAYLVIHTPWNVANGVYDLFATTNLAPTAWHWLLRCAPGQTNLAVTNLASATGFFLLASTNDTDGDSLSDAFERLVSHTDPTLYSTDGSGMSDGWQWQSFGSISNSPSGDPDGDGLTTIQEWQMRTAGYNPAVFDSNTNGVGDAYEDYSGDGLANFMEPYFGGTMMTSSPTWKMDADGDGLPELYETMAGSGGSGLPAYSKNPVP
ncbi:MAG: hypothetical protein ABSG80_11930 [Verrucomicrobiota bacterium]|jgi:hypothetical protein